MGSQSHVECGMKLRKVAKTREKGNVQPYVIEKLREKSNRCSTHSWEWHHFRGFFPSKPLISVDENILPWYTLADLIGLLKSNLFLDRFLLTKSILFCCLARRQTVCEVSADSPMKIRMSAGDYLHYFLRICRAEVPLRWKDEFLLRNS